MKYRVCFTNGYFPTYFRTKREAVAYQQGRPEETILERRITKEVWRPCK